MEHVPENIVVIGSSGSIGRALADQLALQFPTAHLHRVSRDGDVKIDYDDEQSIEGAAKACAELGPLDFVIVANGILHTDDFMPERSLRELSAEKFHAVFQANTITPALIAKHFLPKLSREKRSVFAALSARVGSISDNRLGGWYAYRASKAALNMIIKNAAIEHSRRCKRSIIIGLHPGTVDSTLSKPFQKNVAESQLFTPQYSAQKLINVLEELTPEQTGKCFAWDGQEVLP